MSALKESYISLVTSLLAERETTTEEHLRQWRHMSGETCEILQKHDDKVADELTKMKLFYRGRLEDLEKRNAKLEQELAKYRDPPDKEAEDLKPNVRKVGDWLDRLENTMTEDQKRAFQEADLDEEATDIAMRLRIRKMRDCERLDAMHAKKSY